MYGYVLVCIPQKNIVLKHLKTTKHDSMLQKVFTATDIIEAKPSMS